ncbi:helix-turn-helix domain-containing protein [Streptomyces sp. NPDC006733]|uniref:helix-turn-helix domain-containing protein n=1 Tax=Streptomyces sp. NPDC006733 TaxID=3155460 RepID=UPI0034039FFD
MSGVEATAYTMRLLLRTPAHKLVLLALATRCDQNYSCFPSRALVAGEALLSDQRVKTILRDLRRDGYLTARARFRGNGSKTSNRYYVHGPWDRWNGNAPFPEISHYADQANRFSVIHEGDFVPRPAPKADEQGVGVTDDPYPDPKREGLPAAPPAGSPVGPSEGIADSPSVTHHYEPAIENHLRDVRRTTARGKAEPPRKLAAYDVADDASASAPPSIPGKPAGQPRRSSAIPTTQRRRPPEFDTVAAALPVEVQARPGRQLAPTLVRAICDALASGRTPAQLIIRLDRRWYQVDGPQRSAAGYHGSDRIARPVGFVAKILCAQECPDPNCEAGVDLWTGVPCHACFERRADELAAKQARLAAAARLTTEMSILRAEQEILEAHQRDEGAEKARVRQQLADRGMHGGYLDYAVARHMAARQSQRATPLPATVDDVRLIREALPSESVADHTSQSGELTRQGSYESF